MSGSTKLKKAAATAAVAVPAATSALFLSAEAASASPAAGSYVVQPGDTLSQIAVSHGTSWPALAEANHLANPNLIFPGQVLALDSSTSASTASYTTPVQHTYTPPVQQTYTPPVQQTYTPPPVQHTYTPPVQPTYTPPVQHTYTPPVRHTYTPPVQHTYTPSVHTVNAAPISHTSSRSSASSSSSSSVAPTSGFQSCVIQRESGGNAQVTNSSGHYGLYQFSASTWAAYGGSASAFGHATVAQQNAVFNNAIAAGGASNWTSYDGC